MEPWQRVATVCDVSVSVGSSEALVAVSSCWTQHDVTLSLAATQHDSGQRHNINTAPINANTLPQQQQLTPSILQDWSLMNDEQIVNVSAWQQCMAAVHGSMMAAPCQGDQSVPSAAGVQLGRCQLSSTIHHLIRYSTPRTHQPDI